MFLLMDTRITNIECGMKKNDDITGKIIYLENALALLQIMIESKDIEYDDKCKNPTITRKYQPEET